MNNLRQYIYNLQKEIFPATLLAVTKQRSKKEIKEIILCGITDIGENKLQEIEKKYSQDFFQFLSQHHVRLHFLGHVQSNKAKKIVRYCDVIQSIDSIAIAKNINEQAMLLKKIMPIFLQVNLSEEPQKFGISISIFLSVFQEVQKLPFLSIQGLMCMGKEGDLETTRKIFQKCKQLGGYYKLQGISMGMSDDYRIALEEGSTMVRLGRKIFTS